MQIITCGKYPDKNKMICKECKCVFKYYDNEVIVKTSNALEQDTFGGFGIHKYLICPTCGAICTISCEFIEDKGFFTEIKEWIVRIKNKRRTNKCAKR